MFKKTTLSQSNIFKSWLALKFPGGCASRRAADTCLCLFVRGMFGFGKRTQTVCKLVRISSSQRSHVSSPGFPSFVFTLDTDGQQACIVNSVLHLLETLLKEVAIKTEKQKEREKVGNAFQLTEGHMSICVCEMVYAKKSASPCTLPLTPIPALGGVVSGHMP